VLTLPSPKGRGTVTLIGAMIPNTWLPVTRPINPLTFPSSAPAGFSAAVRASSKALLDRQEPRRAGMVMS
jgi:hypothetical protein